jgi:S-adenosylmethionine:tRNA ribosyltransferase-isomerase
MKLVFGEGLLHAEVTDIVEEGNRLIHFTYDKEKYANIYDVLSVVGLMPLPPYITERLSDNSRYQTVYAREEGSAAAPTAGLHFTPELLTRIREKGVKIAPVMLHVGLGTFRPVKEENITDHVMHTEYFSVPEESARIINERKRAGGRLICVGTTSCRTIESASREDGTVCAMSGDTGIFIYPGYRFKAMDALITNFHLPESTLLMLVSALYDREHILSAYDLAVKEKYRFFSFGDAMLIE